MRKLAPEVICPGHRAVLNCDKRALDTYCDYIDRKERVFRDLVHDPADHYIDLFWARLLPYVSVVSPGQTCEFRLLLRNNLERAATFAARLQPPSGWETSDEFFSMQLEPGGRGELQLTAKASPMADPIRRLLTAEISIDGESQGQISEALVSVR